MSRLAADARLALRELDPRPVELLCGLLSLWFALTWLVAPGDARLQPAGLWAAWCAAAGVAKLLGVGQTISAPRSAAWAWSLRFAGNLLGVGFWTTLAVFLLAITGGRSITWGGFALLALAQAWCLWRVLRGNRP